MYHAIATVVFETLGAGYDRHLPPAYRDDGERARELWGPDWPQSRGSRARSTKKKITGSALDALANKVARIFEKEGIDDPSDYSKSWVGGVVARATGRIVLGVGGSRIVLDLEDGTVLKVAMTTGGEDQNLAEARLFFRAEDEGEQALLDVLVPVLDASPAGAWLRMVKVASVAANDPFEPRLDEILVRTDQIQKILGRYEYDPRFDVSPDVVADVTLGNMGWHDGTLKALDYG